VRPIWRVKEPVGRMSRSGRAGVVEIDIKRSRRVWVAGVGRREYGVSEGGQRPWRSVGVRCRSRGVVDGGGQVDAVRG
jgi:hypothetical protein